MVMAVLFGMCVLGLASAAGEDVASTIIAMERAALDRSDKGDAMGFLEISAPDVSYFDPGLDRAIHGIEALRKYYLSFPVTEGAPGEMTNAKVQVAGEVAVLTFNYASKSLKPPKVTRWNATEVYRRTPKGWRIIHTHWAYLKPELAKGK